MDHLFFNTWEALIRIIVVGIISYATLIILLRGAGKRTLSRMNAYDMVITMALGSILAKVLLTRDVSISESITAMFLLIGLQYLVSVAMCRWGWFRNILSSKPAILFYQGAYIDKTMKRERIAAEEIHAALHAKGISDYRLVEAVILGTNGDLSVVLKPDAMQSLPVSTVSKPSGEL